MMIAITSLRGTPRLRRVWRVCVVIVVDDVDDEVEGEGGSSAGRE